MIKQDSVTTLLKRLGYYWRNRSKPIRTQISVHELDVGTTCKQIIPLADAFEPFHLQSIPTSNHASHDKIQFSQSLEFIRRGDLLGAWDKAATLQEKATDELLRKAASDLAQSLMTGMDWIFSADDASESLSIKFQNYSEDSPTFLEAYSEVPIITGAWIHPTIEVSVNGRTKKFVIDTGASYTLLSAETAADSESVVTAFPGSSSTLTRHQLDTTLGIVQELRIGNVVLINEPVNILSSQTLGNSVVDGLIGWHTLAGVRATFDFKGGCLALQKPKPRIKSPNLFPGYCPIITGHSSEGFPLTFGLDTGDLETLGTSSLFKKGVCTALMRGSTTVMGIAGSERQDIQIVPELMVRVGNKTVSFRDLVVIEKGVRAHSHPDMMFARDLGAVANFTLDLRAGSFEIAP